MKSEKFIGAIKHRQVMFQLCISDRPFGTIKDRYGNLIDWDTLIAPHVKEIVVAEVNHTTKDAVFLSRVSDQISSHWADAYAEASLHQQPSYCVVRSSRSVRMGSSRFGPLRFYMFFFFAHHQILSNLMYLFVFLSDIPGTSGYTTLQKEVYRPRRGS